MPHNYSKFHFVSHNGLQDFNLFCLKILRFTFLKTINHLVTKFGRGYGMRLTPLSQGSGDCSKLTLLHTII